MIIAYVQYHLNQVLWNMLSANNKLACPRGIHKDEQPIILISIKSRKLVNQSRA